MPTQLFSHTSYLHTAVMFRAIIHISRLYEQYVYTVVHVSRGQVGVNNVFDIIGLISIYLPIPFSLQLLYARVYITRTTYCVCFHIFQ